MLNRYYFFFTFIIFLFILIFFNYFKYFPINQVEFSNPDFSITLDKINQFSEIINNFDSLFQYGPGYEYLYKILSLFKFTEISNFYLITHLILPCISIIFFFSLVYFLNIKFSQFILIISILLTLEYFIYSTIRYMPIICLSILILNREVYNKYLFLIFTILYGFFFYVGIDYGLISFIAIVLVLILTNNFNIFDYKKFSVIYYLLFSISINHYFLLGNFNILETLNELYLFSKYFDITDPSFSYQYPFFKFNILDILFLLKNFKIKELIIFFIQDFKTFFLYYFPFIQLVIVFIIIIKNLIKNKNFSSINKNLLFLSAFVFATQIRMLFGPGFIIYNYFQITFLTIILINHLNRDYINIIYFFLSSIFFFLFALISINKFNSHLDKSHLTAVQYPINYEGIYISHDLNHQLKNFNNFINDNEISKAFIYPWSFLTTINKIKKINLIYDDRHSISSSENQNKILEKIINETNEFPYLILDLNYSLGIVFFNDTNNFLTNIRDQFSNFYNNSIVFNGEKNKLREFIASNYIYDRSFGKIHIFKKEKVKNIPIILSYTNFIKKINNNIYDINLDKTVKADFIDIEFEILQNNPFKKFFGQSYINVTFFDDNNEIISISKKPLSRSHYNKNMKMRFFLDSLNNTHYLKRFEIRFEKIKKYNFLNENFEIYNLKYGNINFNFSNTIQ